MRKVFGGILGLLSVLFLGLAYAQMARADATCSSEVAKKISELAEQDKTNLLSLQLQLTTAKLALQTMKAGKRTVEGYIQKQSDIIEKLNEASDRADGKDNGTGVLDKLLALYRTSGASEDDQAAAAEKLAATLDKISVADYRKLETRFKNHELAVFTRAHTLVHGKESPFSEIDSAILWMRSELSDAVEKITHRGSASANLTEASSWVIRFTGIIGAGLTPEELTAEMDGVQKKIDAEFKRIVTEYRAEFAKSCGISSTCTDCQITKADQDSALLNVAVAMKKKLMTDTKFKDERVQRRIVEGAKKRKVEPMLDLAQASAVVLPNPGQVKTETVIPPFKRTSPLADSTAIVVNEKNPYSDESFGMSMTDEKPVAAEIEKKRDVASTDSVKVKSDTTQVKSDTTRVKNDTTRTQANAPIAQNAAALHLERLETLAFDKEYRGDPVKYGPCAVSPMVTRKISVINGKKVNEVFVKFIAKNEKTKTETKGEYHFPEPIGGLVKDIWYPDLAKTPELDKLCSEKS
jgi:hypothetical protein